jgi:hypothetical protein
VIGLKEKKKESITAVKWEESRDDQIKVDEARLIRSLYEIDKNSKKKWRNEKDSQKESYEPLD